MLQACLNGDRPKTANAAVPVTVAELAADAVGVVAAGANELHLHPRGADGLESLEPDDIAQAVRAIRAAVPGVPVGLSTREQIRPGGRARLALLRTWHLLPDYVSVNLGEDDAPEVIDIMLAKGIGIEAGLASVADARRLAGLARAKDCLRVLIEIEVQSVEKALQMAAEAIRVFDDAQLAMPRLLHGFDKTKWPLYREALRRGLDARIGFEDGLLLPSGEPAPDNAALIRAAVGLRAAG